MRTIFLLIILSTFFSMAASAQSRVVEETDTYKKIDTTELQVYKFRPESISGPTPAIAFFHGGGWSGGDPSVFFGACRRFARLGYQTFSFQYRLSRTSSGKTPHPDITPVECVKDARSAMRWLRQNADELKIDPAKIVAAGHSVGGHLALSTAMIGDVNESVDDLSIDPTPDALVIFSGTSNTIEAWCDRMLGEKRGMIWTISPYHNVENNLPPALAFHGTSDCIVPFWTMREFSAKMKSAENDFTLIRTEGKGHHLGPEDEIHGGIWNDEMMVEVDSFLQRQMILPE